MYKELLKKKYKPVLKHSFSCMQKLKREKKALIRLLSMRKFGKFRYEVCKVCKKQVDKLDHESTIVSFTRPPQTNDSYTEWKGYWAHKKCRRLLSALDGWKKGL